jgi:hypothetical protein
MALRAEESGLSRKTAATTNSAMSAVMRMGLRVFLFMLWKPLRANFCGLVYWLPSDFLSRTLAARQRHLLSTIGALELCQQMKEVTRRAVCATAQSR